MGYKKYSYIEMAEEMVEKIKNGGIVNRNTAYRELETIVNEWSGYFVAEQAQWLIDEKYSDLKYK